MLVCVYGNRAYEDTLAELEDTAAEAGFQVVAAVAAVAEHSIVRSVAAGRPDAADRARLQQMAETIRAKLDAGERGRPMIPGHRPYKKGGVSRMVPAPTPACTRCGLCAARCPVGAIDPQDLPVLYALCGRLPPRCPPGRCGAVGRSRGKTRRPVRPAPGTGTVSVRRPAADSPLKEEFL